MSHGFKGQRTKRDKIASTDKKSNQPALLTAKCDHEGVARASNLSIIRVDNKKQNGLMVLAMVVVVDIECSFTFRFRFISDRLIIMRFWLKRQRDRSEITLSQHLKLQIAKLQPLKDLLILAFYCQHGLWLLNVLFQLHPTWILINCAKQLIILQYVNLTSR